jgi:hypothetical protein
MKHVRFYNEFLTEKNKSIRKNLYQSNSQEYVPTKREQNIIDKDIGIANKYMRDLRLLMSIEWKLRFLDAKHFIENNFPHTHADIIFLPSTFFNFSNKQRVNTLIHEKIHVYQRLFPIPYHKMLFDIFNLKIYSYLPTHEKFFMVRQNPDNNLLIYKDGNEYTLPILAQQPKSLHDVSFIPFNSNDKTTKYSKLPTNEHPNETLAYYLTSVIQDSSVPQNIKMFL